MSGFTRIGLVGCGASKLSYPAPARRLYTGSLFRKASAYAETTCDRWYVLSALHCLLNPDEVIEPYDVTLDPTDGEWADQVVAQLRADLADVERPLLVVLAGSRYRTILDQSPWPHEVPMRGLGIGQQLAWLTDWITA